MRVQTEAIHFKADQKLLLFINEKIEKLNRFFDRIMEANIVLKLENSGQVRDKVTEIRVHVPGEVFIATATDKTFEGSTMEAIEILKRQLKQYKDKMIEKR
jgi:putative sigma-54 modulation protein